MEKEGGQIKIPLQQDYVNHRFMETWKKREIGGKKLKLKQKLGKQTNQPVLRIFSNGFY
jgi:hypothetical protein